MIAYYNTWPSLKEHYRSEIKEIIDDNLNDSELRDDLHKVFKNIKEKEDDKVVERYDDDSEYFEMDASDREGQVKEWLGLS